MKNFLVLHQNTSYSNDIVSVLSKYFVDNCYTYNYYNLLYKLGLYNFYRYVKQEIKQKKITHLLLFFNNNDASFSIDFLEYLKKESIELVFIYEDSENSFEFIDRYYAQYADFVIIKDIPFIKDIYSALNIKVYIINDSDIIKYQKTVVNFNISNIKTKTLFASSLNILCKKDMILHKYKLYSQRNYILTNKYYEALYVNKIYSVFNQIMNQNNKNMTCKYFLDRKFVKILYLYKIYWCMIDKNFQCIMQIPIKYILLYAKLIVKMMFKNNFKHHIPSKFINEVLYEDVKI